MIYFGFTIGPVVATIEQARKTRELWAASFVFSYFMKHLLEQLQGFGAILAPNDTSLKNAKPQYGAGIWPDRCFLEISDPKKAEALQKQLPQLVENALEAINAKLGGGQMTQLKSYFRCYACSFDDANDTFTPGTDAEKKLKDTRLFRLNKMLDDLEYIPKFQAVNRFNLLEKLDNNITAFYDEAYGEEDEVLRTWHHGKKAQKRVRSLLEIAIQEFSKTDLYYNEVVLKIEQAIIQYQKTRGKEEQIAEDAVYLKLKNDLGEALKSRHRYIAIVHADGDNIGNTIASLQNDAGKTRAFSAELMSFSEQAVRKIYQYGATPVYAGGDDLLFIAPMQNDEQMTIYDLLKSLHDLFAQQPVFQSNKASLSFGLSISYYKHPLAEALSTSRNLLFGKAKELEIDGKKRKDALAINLLTHSGHQFETTLWQDGDSYPLWLELFKPSEKLEEAFIAGLMHKTDTLALWLWDACNRGTLDAFFKAHFNEAIHTEKGRFLDKIKDLTRAIFVDYALHASANNEEKRLLGQMLHAMLRLVQFQNAPDHD